MWLYPYLTYLTILCILVVMVLMVFDPDLRSQLLLTLLSLGIVLGAYLLRSRFGRVSGRAAGEPVRE